MALNNENLTSFESLNISNINLNDYGFIKAGENKGNLNSYKSCLNSIKNGQIRTKETKLISQSATDIERINNKISKIKIDNSNIKNRIIEINDRKIPNEEQKISKFKAEIESILNVGNDHKVGKRFRLTNFIVGLFFLTILSLYLAFFYVSIADRALYGVDPGKLIGEIGISLGILPDFGILMDTLSKNFFLVVIPSVFFCFGYVLHYFIEELQGTLKFLWIALLVLVTFILDSLMAYKIHEETIKAYRLIYDQEEILEMGLDKPWLQDVNFHIVLMMGFLIFLIWSIIFHQVMHEWSKKDELNSRIRQIDRYEKVIEKYNSDLDDLKSKLDANDLKIDKYEQEKKMGIVNINDLIDNIDTFTEGWIRYLNGISSGGEFSNEVISYCTKYKENAHV